MLRCLSASGRQPSERISSNAPSRHETKPWRNHNPEAEIRHAKAGSRPASGLCRPLQPAPAACTARPPPLTTLSTRDHTKAHLTPGPYPTALLVLIWEAVSSPSACLCQHHRKHISPESPSAPFERSSPTPRPSRRSAALRRARASPTKTLAFRLRPQLKAVSSSPACCASSCATSGCSDGMAPPSLGATQWYSDSTCASRGVNPARSAGGSARRYTVNRRAFCRPHLRAPRRVSALLTAACVWRAEHGRDLNPNPEFRPHCLKKVPRAGSRRWAAMHGPFSLPLLSTLAARASGAMWDVRLTRNEKGRARRPRSPHPASGRSRFCQDPSQSTGRRGLVKLDQLLCWVCIAPKHFPPGCTMLAFMRHDDTMAVVRCILACLHASGA